MDISILQTSKLFNVQVECCVGVQQVDQLYWCRLTSAPYHAWRTLDYVLLWITNCSLEFIAIAQPVLTSMLTLTQITVSNQPIPSIYCLGPQSFTSSIEIKNSPMRWSIRQQLQRNDSCRHSTATATLPGCCCCCCCCCCPNFWGWSNCSVQGTTVNNI